MDDRYEVVVTGRGGLGPAAPCWPSRDVDGYAAAFEKTIHA